MQILSNSGLVNSSLFPPPTKVFLSFTELLRSGEIILHIKSSIWRVLFGLLMGSVAGIIIGLLTGRNNLYDKSFSPLLQIFRSFPAVAIIPLVIAWFGIGEGAKLFSISFAVFFPVWINTHIGSSRIPVHYLQSSSLLTKSIITKWFRVILPASLPFIVAGIRNGIAIAFIMVFVSELAGASSGIGYLISVSHLAYRIDKMIVGLILLGLLGALTDFIFIRMIRRTLPWIEKI
ncbi:MAG: ABC transporter permease [Nanoarchaeota archaeon]|nr:ABC transporter permease [Nanoarchaeota archaeon]